MKKLLALLMACTTMTCAFASCGKEESSESSVLESSVAETTTEEKTTEAATEEETTEEETTEAETEEDTTESDEAEGEWITDDEETEFTTHEYLEDADKTPFVGKWQGEKVEFEGETFTDVMGLPVSVLYQFDIREDGTVAFGEGMLSIIGDAPEYTWGVISEDEIEIVNLAEEDVTILKLDGDYLVGEEDGEVSYLVKVDEFEAFDMESFMNSFSFDDDTSSDTTSAEESEVSGTDTDTINE